MADVVGSDEGAEAAGAGPEQAGQPEGTGAGAEEKSGAGKQTGTPAEAAAETAAPGAEDGSETDADADAEAVAAPGAEAAPDEAAAAGGESAIPEDDGEAASEATDEVVDEAVEEVVADVAAAESAAALEQAAGDAQVIAETEVVVVAESSSEAAQESVETVVVAEAVVAEGAESAAAPPPPVPPTYAPSASFVPPGSSGPAVGATAGSPVPPALDRRKALLIGGAAVIVIGGAVTAFAATGSSGGSSASASGKPGAAGAGAGGKASASSAAAVPAAQVVTIPANGATGVDPSKPITVQVKGGTIESVALSGQEQTNGTLSTDRNSWTSANVLSVDAHYQLTVTAKNPAGKSTTTNVSFRTLSPSATFGVSEVVPPRGSTVGVGQPIRVTFSNYVPQEYKAALEKACVVTTSPPVAGAWYWVSNSTDGAVLDWRPEAFWPVNTKVSINFGLDGVRLGEHQYGVENYKAHDFTISDRDLRLIVDKDTFRATCYENGKVIRTFPIDTGMTTAETFVTYTGTMSVLGKGNPVEMKGNYGPGDTYDDFVNWATQITWSGTYVHAAPWDGDIGEANDDSHGCVHCRTEDAEWFYNKVISGDVVTINGKRARPVDVANGICTFTLDWQSVLKGSAYGPTLNGRPASA